MILGVMSDTHGNSELMHVAAVTLTRVHGADVLFHLGDDYRDAVELSRMGYDVRMVPGLWCPEYRDGRIPKRLVETIDGLDVACAHADKDLRHVERAASIVLTGHTHAANVARIGRTLYINPGHLTARVNRGQPATYAVVLINTDDVAASIHEAVSDRCLDTLTVPRSAIL